MERQTEHWFLPTITQMSDFSGDFRKDDAFLANLLEAECDRLRWQLTNRIPRTLRSVLDVDDVLQQSCIDAFRAINDVHFEEKQAFSVWFETIARRNLIDIVRSLKAVKRGGARRPLAAQDLALSLTDLLSQLFAHSVTASRHAMASESLERLQGAIAKLPEHYRAVVEQYDLQQHTIEQVAQSLKKTVGATFMIRSRAHRLLAEMLRSTIPR